ncbi:MAG: sialate O-acetylesterase [Planctomycetaceae bacterium]
MRVRSILRGFPGGLLWLGLFTPLFADDSPRVISPTPYQVIQRAGFNPVIAPVNAVAEDSRGWADVELVWSAPEAGEWLGRVVFHGKAFGRPVEWTPLKVTLLERQRQALLRVPAGGWYRLELQCRAAGKVVRELSVEPFGVGEVFVIAGQSYAVGANDEVLKVTEPERRVAAFNWRDDAWQVCDDPVPHVGEKGTIWPPLGDVLAPLLQVPVGFVNAAVGGTSTRQWSTDGPLFADLVAAGKKTKRFRYVLWQQGESDVIENTAQEVYVERLIDIRREAMKQWNLDVAWLPAKSTLHPTVYRQPEREDRIRAAIGVLWKTPGFRPGPDTDVLDGENRGGIGSMRHFSGVGQRRAAQLWFAALWQELHRDAGDPPGGP